MPAATPRIALITLLLTLPAAAVAAARPPASSPQATRAPQLSADPATVSAGDTLTLHGTGFPRNAHMTLLAGPPRADATRIGGASTGSRGRFTATIRIRPHSSAGSFVALACHDACSVKASARFRILAR